MNEQRFDKIIKDIANNSASESPVPFTEGAWKSMEQLLDADKRKRRFIGWWWFPLLCLLIGGTTFYLLHNQSSSNPKNNSTVSSNTATAPALKVVVPNANNNVNVPPSTQTKIVAPVTDATNASIHITPKHNNTVAADPIDKTATNKKLSSTTPHTPKVIEVSGATLSQKKANTKSAVTAVPYQSTTASKNEADADNTTSIATKATSSHQNTSTAIPLQSNNAASTTTAIGDSTTLNTTVTKADFAITTAIADSLIQAIPTPTTSVTTPTNTAKKESIKKPTLSRFGFSVLGEVDNTSAKFKHANKVSYGIGVGVDYQISSRFAIATGFTVSRKLYNADSADYKGVAEAWPRWRITNINANCLVYEVPVNVLYKLSSSKQASWFAAAGLSSYFMKNETYNYQYIYYGVPRETEIAYQNENQHWFSILNIAVAYRRQFSKKVAYELTPFLKVPLSGIGNGKINLYSTGVQLSLRFQNK